MNIDYYIAPFIHENFTRIYHNYSCYTITVMFFIMLIVNYYEISISNHTTPIKSKFESLINFILNSHKHNPNDCNNTINFILGILIRLTPLVSIKPIKQPKKSKTDIFHYFILYLFGIISIYIIRFLMMVI